MKVVAFSKRPGRDCTKLRGPLVNRMSKNMSNNVPASVARGVVSPPTEPLSMEVSCVREKDNGSSVVVTKDPKSELELLETLSGRDIRHG